MATRAMAVQLKLAFPFANLARLGRSFRRLRIGCKTHVYMLTFAHFGWAARAGARHACQDIRHVY